MSGFWPPQITGIDYVLVPPKVHWMQKNVFRYLQRSSRSTSNLTFLAMHTWKRIQLVLECALWAALAKTNSVFFSTPRGVYADSACLNSDSAKLSLLQDNHPNINSMFLAEASLEQLILLEMQGRKPKSLVFRAAAQSAALKMKVIRFQLCMPRVEVEGYGGWSEWAQLRKNWKQMGRKETPGTYWLVLPLYC